MWRSGIEPVATVTAARWLSRHLNNGKSVAQFFRDRRASRLLVQRRSLSRSRSGKVRGSYDNGKGGGGRTGGPLIVIAIFLRRGVEGG